MFRISYLSALIAVTVITGMALSAPPPIRQGLEIEDLGVPVRSSVPVRFSMLENGKTGDLHVVGNFASNPLQVFDFNLTQGVAHVTDPIPGAGWRSWHAFPHSNGRFYLGTEGRMLIEYDPATKEVNTFRGEIPRGRRGDMGHMTEGPNGEIYIASYGMYAWRFDPETGELQRYGELPYGFKYFYTMTYREPYLYVCLAGGGDWYLMAWNLDTEEHEVFFQPSEEEKGKNYTRHVGSADDGHAYFYGSFDEDGRRVTRYYRLVDGKPEQVDERPEGLWSSHTQDTRDVWDLSNAPGLEFDTSDLTPTGWTEGISTLRWREEGAEEWNTLTAEATKLDDATVRRLTQTDDGKLLGCTEPYGVFFTFDPETGASEYLGRTVGNIYDLIADGDLAYMSGYSKVFAVYDRTKPWTYHPGENARDVNPTPMLGWGKRNCYMDIGAEDKVYVGGRESRHATGGVVGVYDPATGERITLREEFKDKQIFDLKTINDGKIVVVSWEDELVAYDAEQGAVINRVAKPEDAILAGNIFDGGKDCIVAVSWLDVPENQELSKRAMASQNPGMVYKVNMLTGEILYKNVTKYRFFAGTIRELNRRIHSGPDGCGWFFVIDEENRTWLARVLPEDGSVENVIETGVGGHLCFIDDDIYLYNGGESSGNFTSVKRISNILDR